MLPSRSLPVIRTLSTRPVAQPIRQVNGIRRFAESHGHGSHHAEPVAEAIPYWLYGGVASAFGLYFFTKFVHPSDRTNFISRFLVERESKKQEELDRNDRHTALIEQAARDKALLLNSPGSPTKPIRFQERLNIVSPMNNVAGWSRGRSMDELKTFYEAENAKMDEENAARWERVRQQHLNPTKPHPQDPQNVV